MSEAGLTRDEREALRGLGQGQVPAVVERIVAAREQAAYERGAADVRAAVLSSETERLVIRMAAMSAMQELGSADPALATVVGIKAAQLLSDHRAQKRAESHRSGPRSDEQAADDQLTAGNDDEGASGAREGGMA